MSPLETPLASPLRGVHRDSTTGLQGMEETTLGGELVLGSACLTVSPPITKGQAHTHTQTWIPIKQISTWPLETWHKTDTVHTGCQLLWPEIRWQTSWPTSQKCTWWTLPTYKWLDRQTVYQDNIGLGLQQMPGSPFNAKLCAESFKTIPKQNRQTTVRTISECTNSIWCHETKCNARIKGTTVRWQSQAIHPTGMRQVFIPRQSSW